MAWFAFDDRSLRSLEKSPTISKGGVTLREGNVLTEALARKESILLLPGTEPDSPFLLHIWNRQSAKPRKKGW
jgi:hypothetical protein